MASPSPQRFSGRAGSRLPGRVRRALDAQIDTQRRLGESLDVVDGRMEVKAVRGGGLQMTRNGLALDPMSVGDKNHDPMSRVKDPASTSAADVHATLIELLTELRRTKRMR